MTKPKTIEEAAGATTWVEAVQPHGNELGEKYQKAEGDRYEVTSPAVRQNLIASKLVKASTAPTTDVAKA